MCNIKKWCKWTCMQGRKNSTDIEYEFMITKGWRCGSSVQFRHSVGSDSLRPHRLQYTRLPCPSSTPGAYTSWCPSSPWYNATISSCHPLLLLPSIFSSIRIFSNESVLCIRWPKYCSFSISPSSEYSGLISLRMDWLDLLAVQETLKSLLQHHISKNINYLALSFLFYSPTLTSIHD